MCRHCTCEVLVSDSDVHVPCSIACNGGNCWGWKLLKLWNEHTVRPLNLNAQSNSLWKAAVHSNLKWSSVQYRVWMFQFPSPGCTRSLFAFSQMHCLAQKAEVQEHVGSTCYTEPIIVALCVKLTLLTIESWQQSGVHDRCQLKDATRQFKYPTCRLTTESQPTLQ